MLLLERESLYFDGYFIELYCMGSSWLCVITGSGKGLAPNGAKPLPEPMMMNISDARSIDGEQRVINVTGLQQN